MSLLFADSFDHYVTADITEKWTTTIGTTPVIESSTGRNGTNSLKATTNPAFVLKEGFANTATFILGAAFKFSQLVNRQLLGARDSGSVQCDLQLTAAGELKVTRDGASQLGITSGLGLTTGIWYYIEFKFTINNSGSYVVKVDEVQKLSGSGDTQATGNASGNEVFLSPGDTDNLADDFYACDNSGSVNNDFLGAIRIKSIFSNGAGNYAQWTPSAGSNFQNVDENPPDDDTTYNASSTIDQKDSFDFQAVSLNGDVKGVQINGNVRNDGSGVARFLTRVGGSDSFSSNLSLTGSYKYHLQVRETNPNTSNLWAVSEVDAAEFGYDLVS